VTRENAAAPATGGGGGTGSTASDSTINSVSTTSFALAAGPLTVTAGAAGTVDLSAPLTFSHGGTGSVDTRGKWRWRIVGGSYADVATEINSTDPALQDEPNSGYIEVTQSKTGLTSGTDYEFELQLRRASSTGSVSFAGTATAVAT
jgi:hypothetical protein